MKKLLGILVGLTVLVSGPVARAYVEAPFTLGKIVTESSNEPDRRGNPDPFSRGKQTAAVAPEPCAAACADHKDD